MPRKAAETSSEQEPQGALMGPVGVAVLTALAGRFSANPTDAEMRAAIQCAARCEAMAPAIVADVRKGEDG